MWLPSKLYMFHYVKFILVTPPLKNVRKKRFRKIKKKVSCMLFLCLLGGLGKDYEKGVGEGKETVHWGLICSFIYMFNKHLLSVS